MEDKELTPEEYRKQLFRNIKEQDGQFLSEIAIPGIIRNVNEDEEQS